ncbi:MAG: hypothetical protein CSB47_10030 [Proteobacteria bacterium]|nr:MAG: hypothetical protein CSB47_10030 [Pseudomonadota bacterium]
MFRSFIGRMLDWLIAIAVVCALLWFLITQPLLPVQTVSNLPKVNQSNLKNHVTNLWHIHASKTLARESLTTDSYIFNYFSRLGKPSFQGYSTMSGRHNNVRLRLGPKTKERVVIGVQYLPPTGPERLYWNPSGISVLLETARVLALLEKELPLSVELVAYASSGVAANGTLEMGSLHHAHLLKDENIPVKLMISLKSVGFFTEAHRTQRYPFSFMRVLYPDTGNFISLSSRLQDFVAMRTVKRSFLRIPELPVESFSAPENVPLVAGSDHVNYWLNDYPAVQVSDMLPLRVTADEYSPETTALDYERMARVVQGLVQVVSDLEKPSEQSDMDQGIWSEVVARLSKFFE